MFPDGKTEILTGYDHLSLPPDFRLHLSSQDAHIFFDINPVWDLLKNNNAKPLHYFTFTGLPASHAKDLIPAGKTKTWGPSMMISPFKDPLFNDDTRVFVDFFLHREPLHKDVFESIQPFLPGMRFVGDQHGSVIDGFSFSALQRRAKGVEDLLFTMRFGYINLDSTEMCYVYSPLGIFQKRSKR